MSLGLFVFGAGQLRIGQQDNKCPKLNHRAERGAKSIDITMNPRQSTRETGPRVNDGTSGLSLILIFYGFPRVQIFQGLEALRYAWPVSRWPGMQIMDGLAVPMALRAETSRST